MMLESLYLMRCQFNIELRDYSEDMYEKGKPKEPYELKSFTENSEKINVTVLKFLNKTNI